MTNQSLRMALTKRALAKQLMRAGSPKREAEQVAQRLTQAQRWQRLPMHVRADIAWKTLITPRKNT
ncbi:hypothetical protein VDG44_16355 [Xanthomonas campestris pv. raphani]|uniref:hypothetical protein n=1 Tax=Xanthomonas campestris TaxID=339 RepID=UPI002B23CFFB|nr:hypothetical protein [Xanthomonas campestris]MEA9906097.1 hypothetical protein [Xanthomonas campestris pv. raphani]